MKRAFFAILCIVIIFALTASCGILNQLIKPPEVSTTAPQPSPSAPATAPPPGSQQPPGSSPSAPATTASPSTEPSPAAPASPTDQPPIGTEVGQTAPNFTLSLRGGGSVALWDLRGKPVLLNVSATWCPPCQREFPEIQAIHEAYSGQVSVLVIDLGEDESDIDAYFGRFQYDFPIAIDPKGKIGTDYKIDFIPQTWILDANGIVVDYFPGGSDFDSFSAALNKVVVP